MPIEMIRLAILFARENGIRRYVAVASLSLERMLRKFGMDITRFGAPVRIGRVMTVAGTLEVDEMTEFSLFGTFPEDAQKEAA